MTIPTAFFSSLLLLLPMMLLFQADPAIGGKAFSFQPDNIPTTSSIANVTFKTSSSSSSSSSSSPPVLTNLTVCIRLKVDYFREKTYVYSYATSDKANNELNLGLKEYQAFIAIGNRYTYGWKNATFVPGVWYHICFVADFTTFLVYLDGALHREQSISQRNILMNGSLVLGQEMDKVMGGFQEQQSFSGTIMDFNLYSRALSHEEVTRLATCDSRVEEGDLVAWSTAPWQLQGQVTQLDVEQEEYCNVSQRITVFPERRTWTEASTWCRNLKTSVTLPLTAGANTRVYKLALPFAPVCQPPNHATAFFWLAGTDEGDNGVWSDRKGNTLNFTNFEGTYKSSKRNCLAMLIPPYEEKWDDLSCEGTYSLCVGCQEEGVGGRPVVLKARGLCESDEKAAWFTLHQEPGERPSFKGFTKYKMDVEVGDSRWILVDMWQNMTLAYYPTHDLTYPLGTKVWTLTTDYDVCGLTAGTERILTFSTCYADEYTCADGTCIDLTKRCNLRVDCPDNTDEIGCGKLQRPQDYLASLTPAGVLPGPLRMNLSLSILGFSKINLRDMKLTIDLASTLSWFDQRLQYRNLKDIDEINHIQMEDVWTPKVEYMNADFPEIHTTDPVLNVHRLSQPKPDDPSLYSNDEIFEGGRNPLKMSVKVNAPFLCTMNLRNFPFDTQHCHLLLRLTSARHDFLSWSTLDVSYLGQTLLTEYEVGTVTVKKRTEGNYSVADVELIFYRRFWFYMTSAYLPTVMLMLISYASLFCKRENSDLRVMMSLTTLLVLYALYQQVADGLPRTSYTKAVDVWCFFAITFIFTMVIFHVAVDVVVKVSFGLRRRRHISSTSITSKERSPVSWGGMDKPLSLPRPMASKIMLSARIIYATVVLIFFLVYWTVVLMNVEY